MALSFISRAIWNSYSLDFIKGYCDAFPQLKHTQESILKILNQLVTSNVDIQAREIARSSTPESAPLTPEEKDQIFKDEEVKRKMSMISQLFIDSFSPFEKQLKSCDEKLFLEKKCVFLQHMQLKKVWSSASMTEDDKKNIWHFLNGAYLILQLLIVTPKDIVTKLEKLVSDLFTKVVRNKEKFEKSVFMKSAKTMIHDVETKDISKITDYFWEFISSEFTPIFALLPETYHSKVNIALKIVNSKNGRDYIMKKISPLVNDVKERVGSTNFEVDEDGNVKYNDGDGKEDGKLSVKELENKKRAEKERILECIIDSVASILEKKNDLVKKMIDNPKEGFSLMIEGFTSLAGEFMEGKSSEGPSLSDIKESKARGAGGILEDAPILKVKSKKP
jgi:hypothetical protein